jgi:hypothetical protein
MVCVYFSQEDTEDNLHDRIKAHFSIGRDPNPNLWLIPKNLNLKLDSDLGLQLLEKSCWTPFLVRIPHVNGERRLLQLGYSALACLKIGMSGSEVFPAAKIGHSFPVEAERYITAAHLFAVLTSCLSLPTISPCRRQRQSRGCISDANLTRPAVASLIRIRSQLRAAIASECLLCWA